MADGTHDTPLSDIDLFGTIHHLAVVIDEEQRLAFEAREGSEIQHWHFERAETATVELVRLITAPKNRPFFQRLAKEIAAIRAGLAA